MIYFLIAYLLCLVYLSANRVNTTTFEALQKAWFWFAMVPIGFALFAPLEVGQVNDPQGATQVGLFKNGLAWLFLGLSLMRLSCLIGSSARLVEKD